MGNPRPRVFFDIGFNNQPAGRVVFEVIVPGMWVVANGRMAAGCGVRSCGIGPSLYPRSPVI